LADTGGMARGIVRREREQFLGGFGIALLNPVKNARHAGHMDQTSRVSRQREDQTPPARGPEG